MVCCVLSPPHHYQCVGALEAEKSQDATIDEEPSIITAYD